MLEVNSLSIKYNDQVKYLFSPVSFSLQAGNILCLQGANGSGKTSLLYALCNVIPQILEADRDGLLFLDGKNYNSIPVNLLMPDISMMLSNPHWQLFYPTPEEEIVFVLENAGLQEHEIEERLNNALHLFQLVQFRHAQSASFSYGQQKMILFAVQAAINPKLLLLDEPFDGLSEQNVILVVEWLKAYTKSGGMLIIADHTGLLNSMQTKIFSLSG